MMKNWLAVMSIVAVPLMSPCYAMTFEEAWSADLKGLTTVKPKEYGKLNEAECEELFSIVETSKTFSVRYINAKTLVKDGGLKPFLAGVKALGLIVTDSRYEIGDRLNVAEYLIQLDGKLAQFFVREGLGQFKGDSLPYEIELRALHCWTVLFENELKENKEQPLIKGVHAKLGVQSEAEKVHFLDYCFKHFVDFVALAEQDSEFQAFWITNLQRLVQKIPFSPENLLTYSRNLLNLGVELLLVPSEELQKVGQSFLGFLAQNVSQSFDQESLDLMIFLTKNTLDIEAVVQFLKLKVNPNDQNNNTKTKELRLSLIKTLKDAKDSEKVDLWKGLVVRHVNEGIASYLEQDTKSCYSNYWYSRVSDILSSLDLAFPEVSEWHRSTEKVNALLQQVRIIATERDILCSKAQREIISYINERLSSFKRHVGELLVKTLGVSTDEVIFFMNPVISSANDVVVAANNVIQDIRKSPSWVLSLEEVNYVNSVAAKSVTSWYILKEKDLSNFYSSSNLLNPSSYFNDDMHALQLVGLDSRVSSDAKEQIITTIVSNTKFMSLCDTFTREKDDTLSPEETRKRLVAGLELGYKLVKSIYETLSEPSAAATKLVEDMKSKFKKAGLDFEVKSK